MILNQKTGNLPLNFIFFGLLLLGIGISRILVLDPEGLLFSVISLPFLFIKSGIIIDTDNKRLKKYIGFFMIKIGKWESINPIINLRIIKTKETQTMNVLSITTSETKNVYKLFLVLPKRKIKLMSGKKDYILKKAEKISSSLQIPLKSNIK